MIYKLSDIFDLQMGKTPTRSDLSYWQNGSYDWISISDLNTDRKYISDTKERITTKAVRESGIKKIPANTVIMSFKLSMGKTAITSHDMFSNEAIMAFIDRKVIRINPDYIYYLLHALDWNKRANKAVKGRTVNKKIISQTQVNIPDYQTQLRIVKIMDSTRKRVKIQKDILSKLDTLIKARFVEMFGDPGLVHRENKVCNLENVAEVRSSHRIFTREFTKSGVPFYRGTEISLLANGKEPIHSYYISKARYDEITKNDSKPKIGDLLMPSICDKGQIWLVNTSKPFYYKDGRVLCISPNREKFNTIFFHQYMKMKSQIEYLKIGSGSTFAEFKIFQLKKLKINIPPLKLQNEFASFVQQVDKSKVVNVSIMKYIISIRFYLYFKENKEGAR